MKSNIIFINANMIISEKIYIIGHKSPDLDSVASAIAYAVYKNTFEYTDKYFPGIAGEVNKETVYVLEKFGIALPEKLENVSGLNLILVDYNEEIQGADGQNESKVLEVVDHHKIDFKSSEPINFLTKPWGSTCTIIADKFLNSNLEISASLAGLMLSGILVDTVITKSPTCTDKDREIIPKLASMAGVNNWMEFGLEIFKVRSQVKELSDIDIIKSDFKDFNLKAGKFGVGQVETISLDEFNGRDEGLLEEMNKLKLDGSYHSVVLFITDIIKEGSKFFVVTDDLVKMEIALGQKIENNRVYLEGIISRKKQVAPKVMEVFDK